MLSMIDIKLADFYLSNTWLEEEGGEKYDSSEGDREIPMYLVDHSTGRRYLNETDDIVRLKCVLLSFATPIAHLVMSILNVVYRILKTITLINFWLASENAEDPYNFSGRLRETGLDVARIVLFPITIITLELASIYGWFSPYDGRKLYATIERASYGHSILAPCFQPEADTHAFGGDIKKRDEF